VRKEHVHITHYIDNLMRSCEQDNGEICVMRAFTISTLHQILEWWTGWHL